jgi:hypothetical protein
LVLELHAGSVSRKDRGAAWRVWARLCVSVCLCVRVCVRDRVRVRVRVSVRVVLVLLRGKTDSNTTTLCPSLLV